MFTKYFTPQEAGKRLPYVKKVVADILKKGNALQTMLADREGDNLSRECVALQAEVESLIAELQDLGCFYKDWNFAIGLVDFPARINGQEVFLCWRSDEEALRWYHGVDEGYSGRKLIPENILEE